MQWSFKNTGPVHVVSSDIMLALAWYHSEGSALAGDGSHSTDQRQAEGRATVQAELSRQGDYLNKSYKARLSILILSKAYPFMVYIAM
jgi:hypothetical protein